MVAPFWSDVDTRDGFGTVYMKQVDAGTIAVAWDHVGYFLVHGDKLNTFQVMISDGTNADMGIGNNVCFCYYEMEWTTGDASGGEDGFGGSAATVGANNGDGINYSLIGRFDSISTLEGSMMNVDSLNGQDACFSVGGNNNPPIPIGIPSSGFVELECDETIVDLILTFAAPESDQTTSLQVIPETDLYGMMIDVDDCEQSATATINWNPSGTGPFSVTLQFVAQDSTGGETIVRLTFNAVGPCQEPNGGGDPHFETWSGQKFSFHGECDLVLIQDPEFSAGKGLHVHGRTKIHHAWSAFEGAAVKIGDDVFEIHGKDDYSLNGVANVQLPAKIGGYEVGYVGKHAEHVTRYSIRLGNGTKVILKAYDEFVWVMVEGNNLHKFEGSHGLLGTYQGTMYGRDGKSVYDDPIAFGQEWQVRDTDPQLFHILEGPQFPEKCLLPTHPKLNVDEAVALAGSSAETLEAVKKACEHARAKERNDCIADVLATKDFGMAAAY